MANKSGLLELGKDAFLARWNLGPAAKKELAEQFDYSSPSALENAVNLRSGLGWLQTGKGNSDGERKPRATSNTVSALRQALEDMKSVGLIADVPSLHVGPVEQLTVNPAIAAIIQPFFDAAPLNAAFVLAFRHVPTNQLKEFGLVSNEMREQEKAEKQSLLDRELEAKAFLKTRGWEVVTADHLAADIETWSLRLIESSDFEIGLLHQAEQAAAIAETERLAEIEAANLAEQAARLHDAETVKASMAMDASERELAAIAAAEKAAAEKAEMLAEMAAMREQMAALLAASKPQIKAVKKAA